MCVSASLVLGADYPLSGRITVPVSRTAHHHGGREQRSAPTRTGGRRAQLVDGQPQLLADQPAEVLGQSPAM
jgi:hypothetical protein